MSNDKKNDGIVVTSNDLMTKVMERVTANTDLIVQLKALVSEVLDKAHAQEEAKQEPPKFAWFEIVALDRPGWYKVKWHDDFDHLGEKNYMASRYAVVSYGFLNWWRTPTNSIFDRVNIARCQYALDKFKDEMAKKKKKKRAAAATDDDDSQPRAAKKQKKHKKKNAE